MIFISGQFTAPRAGVYLITFSYRISVEPNEGIWVNLYKDGIRITGTVQRTYYSNGGHGYVNSTGGRVVYQRLEAGNTIHMQTGRMFGWMGNIIMCVEFVSN